MTSPFNLPQLSERPSLGSQTNTCHSRSYSRHACLSNEIFTSRWLPRLRTVKTTIWRAVQATSPPCRFIASPPCIPASDCWFTRYSGVNDKRGFSDAAFTPGGEAGSAHCSDKANNRGVAPTLASLDSSPAGPISVEQPGKRDVSRPIRRISYLKVVDSTCKILSSAGCTISTDQKYVAQSIIPIPLR